MNDLQTHVNTVQVDMLCKKSMIGIWFKALL